MQNKNNDMLTYHVSIHQTPIISNISHGVLRCKYDTKIRVCTNTYFYFLTQVPIYIIANNPYIYIYIYI